MLIRIEPTAVDPSLFEVRRLRDEADALGERIGFTRCLANYRYTVSTAGDGLTAQTHLDPQEAINAIVRAAQRKVRC